jgi:signal recognition particle subunit SEC65
MGLFDFLKKSHKKKDVVQLDSKKEANTAKIKQYIDIPKSIEDKIEYIDKITTNKDLDIASRVNELLKIYESLTDDQKSTKEGRYVILHIAEVYFSERWIEDAFENFNFAMQFKDTVGNPFLHLRLGQLNYIVQNKDKMHDELSRALIMAGEPIFKDEDPKLIEMVKSVLKEPKDCSWAEYEGQDWAITK